MSIASDVAWYLERLPTPPARLHQRGVWSDEDDGHGSELGSPAYTRAFREWLEHQFATTIERYEGRSCDHPTLSESELGANHRAERTGGALPHPCPTCMDTGRRSGERKVYRWAMKAALARVEGMAPAHRGAPRPHSILTQLAMADGEIARVADVLMLAHPCMASRSHAMAHLGNALHRLKRVFSESELPSMPRREILGKSDAQLNAEAAA